MNCKEIDVYFISGQSNASGSTKVTDAASLVADYPAFESGTDPYIIYSGDSAGNDPNNDVTYGWGSVRVGLGADHGRMGPELGITKVFSEYYNEKSGKIAGLIKFAHGGTGMCNTEVNTPPNAKTGRYPGNWTPASYCEHHPEDPALAYKGYLYRGFVAEANKRLRELVEMGYTKINIKGLYWMQGCNDTWRYTTGEETAKRSPRWYPDAFACLVKDWRGEISKTMIELFGDDCGAENMPFFIGTISPTYHMDIPGVVCGDVFSDNGEILDATKKRNDPFIAMQKKLAQDNPNCYTVDNGNYPTVKYVENADGTVTYTIVGTDAYHWNQSDCYQVGQNVGKLLLDICTK